MQKLFLTSCITITDLLTDRSSIKDQSIEHDSEQCDRTKGLSTTKWGHNREFRNAKILVDDAPVSTPPRLIFSQEVD